MISRRHPAIFRTLSRDSRINPWMQVLSAVHPENARDILEGCILRNRCLGAHAYS
jgi:hypothetical protein